MVIEVNKRDKAYMMKVKTRRTYGRGGEEINDTTRHDYVSLELNTLRVGKKNGNQGCIQAYVFPPPLGLSLFSLSSLSLLSLLSFLHFFPFTDPFIVQ